MPKEIFKKVWLSFGLLCIVAFNLTLVFAAYYFTAWLVEINTWWSLFLAAPTIIGTAFTALWIVGSFLYGASFLVRSAIRKLTRGTY